MSRAEIRAKAMELAIRSYTMAAQCRGLNSETPTDEALVARAKFFEQYIKGEA